MEKKRKSKRIELSPECVLYLSIKALEANSNFKNFVEDILESFIEERKMPLLNNE